MELVGDDRCEPCQKGHRTTSGKHGPPSEALKALNKEFNRCVIGSSGKCSGCQWNGGVKEKCKYRRPPPAPPRRRQARPPSGRSLQPIWLGTWLWGQLRRSPGAPWRLLGRPPPPHHPSPPTWSYRPRPPPLPRLPLHHRLDLEDRQHRRSTRGVQRGARAGDGERPVDS